MSLEAVIAKHTEALIENTAVITKHIELQEQILALASARTGGDASADKPATRRRAAAKDTVAEDKADAGNAETSAETVSGPTLDDIKAKLSPWATEFKDNAAEVVEHNARTAALQETYGKLGVKKLGEIKPEDYTKFFKWVNKVTDACRITPELTEASDDAGDDDL